MSAGNCPENRMAKKLRNASTILLKMIPLRLGYTARLKDWRGTGVAQRDWNGALVAHCK